MANEPHPPSALLISETADGASFSVHVQPRASRMEICGIQGSELKVRLTSPPVDDAANRQLEEFIAKTLGIAKSKVTVTSGAKSRHKKLLVRGETAETLASALLP